MPNASSAVLCPYRPTSGARVLEPEALVAGAEAEGYDRLVRRHAWILNRPFVKLAANQAPERARVLDIGSGPGWIPIELAARRRGWELHGADASGDMVALAARNAEAAGVAGRVRFHRSDGRALPFEPASFDLVISHYVLHHLEAPEELFDEAARLVKPGGCVMIKDLRRPPAWAVPALAGIARHVLRYDEAQVRMYRESLGAALSPAELRAALRRSRLRDVRVRETFGLEFLVLAHCR
ncbi:MAG: class I SAM-dependent methyltransferase [Planctomycetes bacterium]|nr:class I SAM-dependent methyltransferase [Planctomycetota bacterium]